jgi:hypothetical protein
LASPARRRRRRVTVVERRAADGRSVQMTLEELAGAVGSRFGDAHSDEETG